MAMVKFRAPPLPIAGQNYKQEYFAQLNHALSLYFNQLDSLAPVQWEKVTADEFVGGLLLGDGRGISRPYLSIIDGADQYLTAALTPKRVRFNGSQSANQIMNIGEGAVYAIYDGTYSYQYTMQMVNTDNSQHAVWVWLKVNGVDLAHTTVKYVVPSRKTSDLHGYIVAVSNLIINLKKGDYVECWWAAEKIYVPSGSAGVYMEYYGANSDGFNHPSLPSALANIVFVSALPEANVNSVNALGMVGQVTATTT